VRLGQADANGSLDAFGSAFSGLEVVDEDDGTLRVDDPEYGAVVFRPDGRVEAEGRTVDPSEWTVAGHAAIISASR
jgi:hypothetical protein